MLAYPDNLFIRYSFPSVSWGPGLIHVFAATRQKIQIKQPACLSTYLSFYLDLSIRLPTNCLFLGGTAFMQLFSLLKGLGIKYSFRNLWREGRECKVARYKVSNSVFAPYPSCCCFCFFLFVDEIQQSGNTAGTEVI